MEALSDIANRPGQEWIKPYLDIPLNAYQGKNRLELFADEVPPPKEIRAGALVDCFFFDAEAEPQWEGYSGFVQQGSTEIEDEDHLLVTFNDGKTEWTPKKWCKYQYPALLWEAGPFLYNYWVDHQHLEPFQEYSDFHYAMQSLAHDFPNAPPALFTRSSGSSGIYVPLEKNVEEERDVEIECAAMDPRLKSYINVTRPELPVYHEVNLRQGMKLTGKFHTFELYRDEPLAASVFPPSYGTVQEALDDSSEDSELFFLKETDVDAGLGIRVLRRSELVNEPEPEPGRVVIQKAVKDLLTIDEPPDGTLFGRRFDIRFHLVVWNGRVFMHYSATGLWRSGGMAYDPNDPSIENQVPKILKQDEHETFFFSPRPLRDGWRTGGGRKFQRSTPTTAFDPAAWLEEIAISVSKALPTLKPLMEWTLEDPFSYQLIGGDAMLRRNTGEAILCEWNVLPELGTFGPDRDLCESEGECGLRNVMMSASSPYILTLPSLDDKKLRSAQTAEIFRDMASLVMGLEPPEKLDSFREIKPLDEASIDQVSTDEL